MKDNDSAVTTDGQEEVLGVRSDDQEEMKAVANEEILEDKCCTVRIYDFQKVEVMGVENGDQEDSKVMGVESDQEIVEDKDLAVRTDGQEEVSGVGNDAEEEVDVVGVDNAATLLDANSDDEAIELATSLISISKESDLVEGIDDTSEPEEATPTLEINITIATPAEEGKEEVYVDPHLVGETESPGSSDSSSEEDTVPDELIPKTMKPSLNQSKADSVTNAFRTSPPFLICNDHITVARTLSSPQNPKAELKKIPEVSSIVKCGAQQLQNSHCLMVPLP
eukprot:scaffold22653_cov119-Cylindrotheca_fusiformis.AAC.4